MSISAVVAVAFFASFSVFLVSGGPAVLHLDSLQVVSSYVYNDTNGADIQEHMSACEADTLSVNATVVVTFQLGDPMSGGAAGIGFATSVDGGRSWTRGVLPGQTQYSGNNDWNKVTDPSVGYSKRNHTWFICTLPIRTDRAVNAIGISRSTKSGQTWSLPTYSSVTVDEHGTYYDNQWIACDNFPTSPYYGNCYMPWEHVGKGFVFYMSTSTTGV
eukprot:CAMPEP_0184665160 /NCGR_PEP_ID=MMETSP0308-20130426/55993_1 /TAXON_ID=38269 /ORGANISM="Gloeochaete witrockiana, Strain SAG 46.84" /LENGTH=215 /DNA_ID=CAMNT_0027108981 /DNA_START=8 /DNA_END=652 /DNA_ORIENTATION=+